MYHSILGWRVIKTKKNKVVLNANVAGGQLLGRNMKGSQGGLVFKAHRLVYHSTLGLRVIKKKKFRVQGERGGTWRGGRAEALV